MCKGEMSVEVWLYGKLRRFAPHKEAGSNSVLPVQVKAGESIERVLARLGVPWEEVGNVFLNGRLALVEQAVVDGDRLGVFPQDMGLLYC